MAKKNFYKQWKRVEKSEKAGINKHHINILMIVRNLGDHNMCRNPNNRPDGLWCYTTDLDTRWEYCNDKTTALDRDTE